MATLWAFKHTIVFLLLVIAFVCQLIMIVREARKAKR